MSPVSINEIGLFLNHILLGFEDFIFVGFIILITNSIGIFFINLLTGGK